MSDHEPLDWMGSGYDVFRSVPTARTRPNHGDAWSVLEDAVAAARQGSFDLIHKLPAAIANTKDAVFHSAACEVLGDAGNAADLETLVQTLESVELENGYHIARALVSRGRLVDVPAVFFFYELNQEHKDTQAVQAWLNWWLCDGDETFTPPGADVSWDEYRAQVGARYFALWNELGTNLIHIHRGRVFDLADVVDRMLADLQRGNLYFRDRHIFEATTGLSCSKWYRGGRPNLLQAAADLERFAESGRTATYPNGQRAFMGHPLEDVGTAATLLKAYPGNNGMGVPFVRTTFDVDSDFALEYGFEWHGRGYFYDSPRPPPTADVPITKVSPWLTLHTCLRESKRGNRKPLKQLAQQLSPGQDDMCQTSAVELLADAADDSVIDPWRTLIAKDEDPDFTFDLCCGLLRRGILRDVPLVLEAYRRNREHPYYPYLQTLLNWMFAYAPVQFAFEPSLSVDACYDEVMLRYESLRRQLSRDNVPVFRGELMSVRGIAKEVIELKHGPDVTHDLRYRFESSTGIDCSNWAEADTARFNAKTAATVAQKFLNSAEAAAFEPGQLYFFGRPIDQ